MALTRTFYAKDRAEWRAWLETNHTLETEIWLLFYKRHTGKPRVAYPDAVEEALCFGWIDSTIRRVDDATYAQRFTPRRPGSSWSELNKRRVSRLVQEGRMTKAGLAKVDFALPDPDSPRPPSEEARAPGLARGGAPGVSAGVGELRPASALSEAQRNRLDLRRQEGRDARAAHPRGARPPRARRAARDEVDPSPWPGDCHAAYTACMLRV